MLNRNQLCITFFIFLFSISAYGNAEQTSTLSDQKDVEVTVYNSNLALVKDVRDIKLNVGRVSLRFMDIASRINPKSVQIKSLSQPKKLEVLEQNYEYDLMSYSKLMDKYIGKKVKLLRRNEFKETSEIVQAILLSNNNNQPIYKIDNEIYLGYSGRVILPEIPENLIATPTLVYLLDNKTDKEHKIQVSYLTNDMNWSADYVMVVSLDDKSSDLNGWVTINNRSGATYRDAKLKLIAGEVHRLEGEKLQRIYAAKAGSQTPKPQFKEEEFFEYHIYTLNRRSNIKNNQEKQIQLLESTNIPVKKELIVYGNQGYFTRRYTEKIPKQDVFVYINFKNSKSNKMGIPLPAGTIRIYKPDKENALQFIGEDRIDHTPIDEEVKIRVGKAFDVVCERVQTDYERISDKVYEIEWEISIRNHKKEEVEVGLIEPLFGDWKIIKSNVQYKKIDAHTIRFNVQVPSNGEIKVNYRVRVSF
mgnify:CR=1 FL=1